MKFSHIDIETKDGRCDSFVVCPNTNERFPGVVLYTDAFGIRPYIEELATKLASFGYYVLVPNLFYRVKHSPVVDDKFPLTEEQIPEIFAELKPMIQSYTTEHKTNDVRSFMEFLMHNESIIPDRIGALGYCMGGGLAIRTASMFPDYIKALASFHAGRLVSDQPGSPHLLLNNVNGQMYFAHADQDDSMLPAQIKIFEQTLVKTGLQYKSEVYKGAKHGFTMHDLPAFNEAADQKHWNNLISLFSRTLKVH